MTWRNGFGLRMPIMEQAHARRKHILRTKFTYNCFSIQWLILCTHGIWENHSLMYVKMCTFDWACIILWKISVDKILRQNLFVEKMSVMRCLFIHQIISDELKHNVGTVFVPAFKFGWNWVIPQKLRSHFPPNFLSRPQIIKLKNNCDRQLCLTLSLNTFFPRTENSLTVKKPKRWMCSCSFGWKTIKSLTIKK